MYTEINIQNVMFINLNYLILIRKVHLHKCMEHCNEKNSGKLTESYVKIFIPYCSLVC